MNNGVFWIRNDNSGWVKSGAKTMRGACAYSSRYARASLGNSLEVGMYDPETRRVEVIAAVVDGEWVIPEYC